MALTARLEMRQGQSLVMTPQLLQAIKLLQLNHVELHAFVDNELERNPLLEREDSSVGPTTDEDPHAGLDVFDASPMVGTNADQPSDWSSSELETDRGALEANLDTRLDNVFESETPQIARLETQGGDMLPLSGGVSGGSAGGQYGDEDLPGIEERLTADISLQEHLGTQLDMAITDPVDKFIGHYLIDSIDDNGYLSEPLVDIAVRLRIQDERALRILKIIQNFDPAGVGARDLADCLAIQLREQDRFDPAMQAMVANLPLLAKRDFMALRKICGVDDEDMYEMIAEIRALDPKPGRAFSGGVSQSVVPDVLVRAAPDGSWLVDVNPETLPRVLINQTYHARISRAARTDADKSFIAECLQTASWLTRSLEQRARTILKVASEIVRQQDGFFAYGVEHLRPLNLKTVADAISMHESTVSRVTSNKYLMSPRGLFEMKFFFSASIPATAYGEAHSAEAVRFKIRQMIEGESRDDILSDDAIVVKLKETGIDIARRTVAKYRESLKIPSSMDRRRKKTPHDAAFAS
jgi:RNA polymerase sigma-54 factor